MFYGLNNFYDCDNRSWIPILEKEFAKPYFSRLDSFLERETSAKKIFPPRELVFSAFSACAFDDIKVLDILRFYTPI